MKEPINLVTKIHINLAQACITILILGVLSCKSQRASESNTEQLNGRLILLQQDGYSGIEEFETIVVTDQKTLNGFYAKINKTRKPGLPVPKIDFLSEMVVIVCMGEQSGDDLPDLIVKKDDDEKVVLQINPYDSEKEEHTSLTSSPFCVYKIPLTSKEIAFTKD